MRIGHKSQQILLMFLSMILILALSSCAAAVKSQGYIGQRPVEMPGAFGGEDMVVNSLRVGELTYDDVRATLGEPKSLKGTGSRIAEYDGMELEFRLGSGGLVLSSITIIDGSIEGPRGINLGDKIDSVIGRFPSRAYEKNKIGTAQILYSHGEGKQLQTPFGTIEFYSRDEGVLDYWFCFSGEGKTLEDAKDKMGNLGVHFKDGRVTRIKIFSGNI
jgi:hypothetical protein